MKLQGMFALAATPFDHTGAIYRAKVAAQFRQVAAHQSGGLRRGSMAGEGPLLEPAEKVELLHLAAGVAADARCSDRRRFAGRRPWRGAALAGHERSRSTCGDQPPHRMNIAICRIRPTCPSSTFGRWRTSRRCRC